jgi:VWFA-related protein
MRKFGVFTLTVAALCQGPIQITTRLVQVTVIVRDKNGPLSDLTKNDFEVSDKGKSRPLAMFRMTRANNGAPPVTPEPDKFSNRIDQQNDSPVAATVLLFDRLNTPFKDQVAAREQMLKLLRLIDPASPIAIYALGDDLRILHDFTQNHERLSRALQAYRPAPSVQLANSKDAPGLSPTADANGLLAQISGSLQEYATDRRVSMTLAAMQVIANRMAGVSGRKNLIWVSGAFPLQVGFERNGVGAATSPIRYEGDLKNAAESIDRADVAVYPVDARGLLLNNSVRTSMPAPRNQTGFGVHSTYQIPEDMVQNRETDTMELLASWTGGKAFINTNDLQGAIRKAIEDSEVTYTLGFYVDEKELDGTYHELKVKVDRKGADVRYRKGYFATRVGSPGSAPLIAVLNNAAMSPADATGMPLTAWLNPDPAKAGSFILTLNVSLKNLAFQEKNGHWVDAVDFTLIQQSADGRKLDQTSNVINLNVTDENHARLLKDGIDLKFSLTPAPNMSQIRVATMDQATGNIGSLRISPALK